jgi:hypothetical protein
MKPFLNYARYIFVLSFAFVSLGNLVFAWGARATRRLR